MKHTETLRCEECGAMARATAVMAKPMAIQMSVTHRADGSHELSIFRSSTAERIGGTIVHTNCEHYALGSDSDRYCGLCGQPLPPRPPRFTGAARTVLSLAQRVRRALGHG